MDLAGDDPASDGGERGESEMSPDSVPVSPGEPDPLPQLKRPTGVADIREDSNVGPDSADPDNLQEAYVDFGNKEANASIRDFSIDDFDEEGLIAETPTLHFMYSSPQFDGQLPGDIFSEPTFDKNLEDDSFEGVFVENDPVEPAMGPTTPVDTPPAVTPPPPPVTQEGPSSRLHILARELLYDDDPEKIVICVSSFIAAELDTRLQSSRETQIFADLETQIFVDLEIQMQRGRVDRVKTSLATRLSSLAELDLSITSCAIEIDQLRRTLREKEETLDIL
ncbi:uncharacterized protein LOC109833604 [Asparagus officinalis]|uniref:uncharacterized protein LOC109833604 n=1 Tax=Asparagus officinalis TaxID=4686 RepID=UPI00098E4EC4|nr:uncharacterized protein LOC109833604 [Asparagus officinalis]